MTGSNSYCHLTDEPTEEPRCQVQVQLNPTDPTKSTYFFLYATPIASNFWPLQSEFLLMLSIFPGRTKPVLTFVKGFVFSFWDLPAAQSSPVSSPPQGGLHGAGVGGDGLDWPGGRSFCLMKDFITGIKMKSCSVTALSHKRWHFNFHLPDSNRYWIQAGKMRAFPLSCYSPNLELRQDWEKSVLSVRMDAEWWGGLQRPPARAHILALPCMGSEHWRKKFKTLKMTFVKRKQCSTYFIKVLVETKWDI